MLRSNVTPTSEHDYPDLHQAAESGQMTTVLHLLENGTDIATKDAEGHTALHLASRSGHPEIVRLLLDKGADASARTFDGFTPMAFAIGLDDTSVIRQLLERAGVDVDADVASSFSALHVAALLGKIEAARLLLSHGAEVSKQDDFGWTPLHRGAANGHVSVLRLLLDHGAIVSARSTKGSTPLHLAADCGRLEAAQVLIEKGADIEAKDTAGHSVLHRTAASTGDATVGRLLIDKGASLFARDSLGATALHQAAARGNEAMVGLLLGEGADSAAIDINGHTPLHAALLKGEMNENVVRLLLGQGADANGKDGFNRRPPSHDTALIPTMNLGQPGPYGDISQWPEIRPSAAGMNNPEGMANIRVNNLLATGTLKLPNNDQLGIEQQKLLCESCANLKLTALSFLPRPFANPATPREEYDELIERPFAEIRRQVLCPLCQLIRHAIEASCQDKQISNYRDGLICVLYMTRFCCFWDHTGRYETFRFLSVKAFLPNQPRIWEYRDQYSISDGSLKSLPYQLRSVISADLVPVESPKYPLCFVGRAVGPSVSTRMIRRWLDQCEIVHGDKCASLEPPGSIFGSVSASPLPESARFGLLLPSLYFIDIQENCLTRLPSGDRYVALSYVWGNCHSLQVSRNTILKLQTPGSLLRLQSELSAVIIDAMTLTADIGERYLWVDSLCIVQDDLENKQAAINMMNWVYGNALLTIIAATGADANVGLPGVGTRPRSRQQESAIIGPHLKLIVPHSFEALGQSAWSKRAWTFQEYLFSPRRLIFINGQIIFKCCWDAPSREDILSEYQIFGMEDYTYKLPHQECLDLPLMRKYKHYSAFLYLPELIREFSRRQLSYQSDILNAFAGIAAMFANECKVELCCGLIKSAMTSSMLWVPVKPFDSCSRRIGFPSWSWCGWVGEVCVKSEDVTASWTEKYSWIDWYLFDEEKGHFCLLPQQYSVPENADENPHEAFLASLNTESSALGRLLKGDRDVSGPQYLDMLQRHPDPDTSPAVALPTTKLLAPFRPCENTLSTPGVSPNSHTLYFRTLATTVHISPYDPEGHLQASQNHVHIYDSSDQYLGVGSITDTALWLSEFGISQGSDGAFEPRSKLKKIPLQMAVLAGPTLPSKTDQQHNSSDVASGTLRFWHIMLLKRRIYSTNPMNGLLQNCHERAGIGEIMFDTLESIAGLHWEDIVIQ